MLPTKEKGLQQINPVTIRRLENADAEQLQTEILRLRDLLIGKEMELGNALGRCTELQAELDAVDAKSNRCECKVTVVKSRLRQSALHALEYTPALRARLRALQSRTN